MTLKQLLSTLDYAALLPTLEQLVAADSTDLRPTDMKMRELEEGFASIKALRPTFGHVDVAIEVKLLSGRLIVSNTHLGSNSDLLSHQVKVAPGVTATPAEIAAHIIHQLVAHENQWKRYREEDDFDDMDNIQQAQLLR